MLIKRLLQSLFRGLPTPFVIPFPTQPAHAVKVPASVAPRQALAALDLPPTRGTVVMHGGAGGMGPEQVVDVLRFLSEGLAPFAEQHSILVIDGGTASGAMAANGASRRAVQGTYPLVGVAPLGTVSYPGGPAEDETHFALDDGHSHFILVEGDDFGIESDLLVHLLRAAGQPGVALIVNGGDIVFQEAQQQAQLGNILVVVKGSGRTADELADPASERRAALPRYAKVEVVDLGDPAGFQALLGRLLR